MAADYRGKDIDAFAYASALDALGLGDTSKAAFEQAAEIDLLNQLAASGAPSIVPTPTQQSTVQEETQTLLDIIREAGGEVKDAVIEGTADLGNLVIQAVTLGQGPRLEAVIPNILDLIKGRVGGQLVFGGGQTPVSVAGTGQTGVGAGTKVGIQEPIGWIVDIMKGGIADLGSIVRGLPGTIGQNLPTILASAAAADYDLTPSDKETLVALGAEPSILAEDKVGGSETVLPAITDSTTITSADADTVKVGGLGALDTDADVKVGGLGALGTDADVKVGGLNALGTDADIKVGGLSLAGADTDQVKVGAEGLPEIKTPAITATDTTTTAGGGGGGAGGFGTPTGGVETVSVEPGPLVDIPGFYDISSMSIIPDYIDELVERERRRQTRGAAEGGHVKKFEQGGMSYADYEQNILGNTSNTGTGGGNSSVRGKLSQFVSDNAGALLTSAVGGLFGLLDNDTQQPAGYQGGIPDYTAQRSLLPGAFEEIKVYKEP